MVLVPEKITCPAVRRVGHCDVYRDRGRSNRNHPVYDRTNGAVLATSSSPMLREPTTGPTLPATSCPAPARELHRLWPIAAGQIVTPGIYTDTMNTATTPSPSPRQLPVPAQFRQPIWPLALTQARWLNPHRRSQSIAPTWLPTMSVSMPVCDGRNRDNRSMTGPAKALLHYQLFSTPGTPPTGATRLAPIPWRGPAMTTQPLTSTARSLRSS